MVLQGTALEVGCSPGSDMVLGLWSWRGYGARGTALGRIWSWGYGPGGDMGPGVQPWKGLQPFNGVWPWGHGPGGAYSPGMGYGPGGGMALDGGMALGVQPWRVYGPGGIALEGGMASQVDGQTRVKIIPSRNFVCGR